MRGSSVATITSRTRFASARTLDHAAQHRDSGDGRKRLPREPRGLIAGGNQGDRRHDGRNATRCLSSVPCPSAFPPRLRAPVRRAFSPSPRTREASARRRSPQTLPSTSERCARTCRFSSIGLDDQGSLDRMFTLRSPAPGGGNLKHAWAERSFDRVIQLGQYGVHFVTSPPDLASLKARADDPNTLGRIIERTQWDGLIILDTKSDLEALTLNALHAADRIVLPVADWASLEEAGKLYAILERSDRANRARVLFTLVDARTRVDDPRQDLRTVLEAEIDAARLGALRVLSLAQPARRSAELRARPPALDSAPRPGHDRPPTDARLGGRGADGSRSWRRGRSAPGRAGG